MKSIDKDIVVDKMGVEAQKQVEKKRSFLGTQPVYPNQRCFEIHNITGEIREADYKHHATFGGGYKKQVDVKEDCQYIIAINKKNALKRFKKAS